MASSSASATTEHGSRYLQQLCKHWAHQFLVAFDPKRGDVDFGGGQKVELHASPAALLVTVRADSVPELPELKRVVEDHLNRFAFRENLEFVWSADADTNA